MAFLHPWFLLLGLAVLIPIAVHLFNFHKFKTVYFSNVAMLKDVNQANKKQNKLFERLLLIFRCLTIILLALLFSGPYIKSDNPLKQVSGDNAVVIILDNSFSMQNLASKGTMLETAKSKINEILDQYSDHDAFCLITMDLEGKHLHFVSKQIFSELVKDVDISPSSRNFSELLDKANHMLMLRNESSKRVFLVSDFQTSQFDVDSFKQSGDIQTAFVCLDAKNIDNIYIDSISFDRSIFQKGQKVDILVSVRNCSQEDVEDLPVKLFIDSKQQSIANISVPKNSRISVPMSFVIENSGLLEGKISILDNPVVYDDDFYFALNIKEKLSLLCVNGEGENKYLNRLFGDNEEVSIKNIPSSSLNLEAFEDNDIVIFNELKTLPQDLAPQVNSFRQQGGCLLIIPNRAMDIGQYNPFLSRIEMPQYSTLNTKKTKVIKLDHQNPLYKGVFSVVDENMLLPNVNKYYKIGKANSVEIMSLANGDAFWVECGQQSGRSYMFAVAMSEDFSDFVSQSIFVPTLWNMVLYSYTLLNTDKYLNDDSPIIIENPKNVEDGAFFVVKSDRDIKITPSLQMHDGKHLGFQLAHLIKEAGYYYLYNNDKKIGLLAYNYPRGESELRFLSTSDIKKQLKNSSLKNTSVFNDNKMISTYFKQSNKSVEFSHVLLALLLPSLLFEALILRKLNNNHKTN